MNKLIGIFLIGFTHGYLCDAAGFEWFSFEHSLSFFAVIAGGLLMSIGEGLDK